jgi:hypothetical protein
MVHNHIYKMVRAQKMMGYVVAAHESHEDFLTLLGDADSDVYQQASRVRQTAQELGDSFQAKAHIPTINTISLSGLPIRKRLGFALLSSSIRTSPFFEPLPCSSQATNGSWRSIAIP